MGIAPAGALNAYAQAVIQTMRADEHERGCLAEERVLGGELTYHRPEERLPADEERFVLLAMHKILVERGLCLREHTDTGTMLIFPSYYRRERPELVGHPAALVSYRFNGFLEEIYATLVVRLHHTKPFMQDQLWRYAADFKTHENPNPNGIVSFSPGLRGTSYPGFVRQTSPTPTGLRPIRSRRFRAPLATTPLGLHSHSDDFPKVARSSQPWAG